ncbi:hypothetical protein FLW53_19140 [Microbispora sp. SCL1-1]|uniref:hypothetical protein n=1 Tax=Microbispora TaxID=2005 RepID=UPI00115BE17B|nr:MULTISPECIES: hypothetical protein [unclassified Microbispora]NJP26278.1 hypothetical protein [Microbispora sp. CL1-1]TQS12381.1 hypothetical protein FLW53_19140 [Microbispora sp. SCL1-1]
MTTINRGTLLELVRNRPLLAAELLGDAFATGDEEPAGGKALLWRFPRQDHMSQDRMSHDHVGPDHMSADGPVLAARYREIVADARRARAHRAEAVLAGLIAFLRARVREDLDQARRNADAGEPGSHKLERDLAAKRSRLDYLESVLVKELYLAIEEHAQAEHLLRLEASAYNWHADYQEAWRP